MITKVGNSIARVGNAIARYPNIQQSEGYIPVMTSPTSPAPFETYYKSYLTEGAGGSNCYDQDPDTWTYDSNYYIYPIVTHSRIVLDQPIYAYKMYYKIRCEIIASDPPPCSVHPQLKDEYGNILFSFSTTSLLPPSTTFEGYVDIQMDVASKEFTFEFERFYSVLPRTGVRCGLYELQLYRFGG